MDANKISSLPDDILVYILSFLGKKYVVSTSVLSTRWKYLWTSVPNLRFSEYSRGDPMIFKSFLDRVLRLLNVPYIHKCFLSLRNTHDTTQIHGWVATILAAKVQELNFKMSEGSPHVLPGSFFTCDSLKKLELKLDSVNIPTSMCFSSLKVLRLDNIRFLCDHSSQQVSLTFPVLDYFLLHECDWVNIKVVNIFAPKLKNFYLNDYANLRSNRHRDCEIKVYEESLVGLHLWTVLSYEISLYNIPSLVKASFDVPSSNLLVFSSLIELRIYIGCTPCIPECCNVTARQLVDLLCHLPTVSSFCFDNVSIETLVYKDDHALEAILLSVLPHLNWGYLLAFSSHFVDIKRDLSHHFEPFRY
ncbi:hypothetical protein AQUCO_04700101v1 [Aquilegia coerulea]|uniref:F-box domain-containing protein n=1 Tax=Aquilegia coerulea TaxID=218851 RepID=A0A2G5CL31_AQUCA|nr:hypothetical protein AQUCO_04700101v1 [Aquilegia coerulea]